MHEADSAGGDGAEAGGDAESEGAAALGAGETELETAAAAAAAVRALPHGCFYVNCSATGLQYLLCAPRPADAAAVAAGALSPRATADSPAEGGRKRYVEALPGAR